MKIHEVTQPVQGFSSSSTYSFIAWVATYFLYIIFVVWSLLPSHFLHSFGVTYYPSKYYAIAIPSYLLVFIILIGIAYIGLNMMTTEPPESFLTFRDANKVYEMNQGGNGSSAPEDSPSVSSTSAIPLFSSSSFSFSSSSSSNSDDTYVPIMPSKKIPCSMTEGIPDVGDLDIIEFWKIYDK